MARIRRQVSNGAERTGWARGMKSARSLAGALTTEPESKPKSPPANPGQVVNILNVLISAAFFSFADCRRRTSTNKEDERG
jgi:hypothetical protein